MKKTFKLILKSLLIIGLFMSMANSAVLSSKQIKTLKMVKKIAIQYPNKVGETFENTAMAICLTETSAGVFKVGDIGKDPNIFNASLGIMQVRLETAKFLAKKLNWTEVLNMSDVKLVNKLLGDDEFNVKVAVRFIVWLNDYTNHNYFRTVSRYNGGNYNRSYYYRVMKNMQIVKETIK
jgi:hypothetical protein